MIALKKIWHGILDAIAWVTQDNSRLRKARDNTLSKHEVINAISRFRHWR
jgi:hypothetical protein